MNEVNEVLRVDDLNGSSLKVSIVQLNWILKIEKEYLRGYWEVMNNGKLRKILFVEQILSMKSINHAKYCVDLKKIEFSLNFEIFDLFSKEFKWI